MTSIAHHTNRIQDGAASRAVYEAFRHEPPRTLNVLMETVTLAQTVNAVIPWNGKLDMVYAVGNQTSDSNGDIVFSFGVNGVNLSGNVMTVATGTARGGMQIPSLAFTANARIVNAGDIMSFNSNGITGTSQPGAFDVMFTVVVQID